MTAHAAWPPEDFAAGFFGPGNRLRWDAIVAGALPSETLARLEPWLDDLRTRRDPLILPRAREDGSVAWYALAASPRSARALRERLVAFIGPSYSEFRGEAVTSDGSDPVDAAVAACAPGAAFRFEAPDASLRDAVRARLLLLRAVAREVPPRVARFARPAGRVLADFELALRRRDGAAADAFLQELQRLGSLSAQNQLFLDILRREAVGDWDGVLDPRRLGVLLDLARPRRVTRALVRALYVREVARFEQSADAVGAARHFASSVWPRFAGLFRTRAGLDGAEVDKCFLLAAGAASPPRTAVRDEVLATHPVGAPDRAFVEALARLVPEVASPQVDPLVRARAAYDDGDVDVAFRAALEAPASVPRLALLLRCARDLDTLDAASTAVSAVDNTTPALRAELFQRSAIRGLWERALDLATRPAAQEEPSAGGLHGWLARLTGAEPWPAALAVLERGVREWPRDVWLADTSALEATARALVATRPAWGDEALRAATPHLLGYLLGDKQPRVLKPVLEEFATVLALDDQPREEQLQALTEVTQALIRIGLDADGYRAALRTLCDAWERIGAATLCDWALDALDALVSLASPAPDAREDFFERVVRYVRRHRRRVSPSQRALLDALAAELGLSIPPDREDAPVAGTTEVDLAARFSNLRVALYSLRASTLGRVASVLSALSPKARVTCFDDMVGGAPALKQAASTADIFVIATTCAKHAATEFIEANRPPGAVTLYASGQGSASMIRELERWAAGARGT